MFSEEKATGVVQEIYQEIKSTLNIGFVPNLYKSLALNSTDLELDWSRVNTIMVNEGKPDRLTKEIIAVVVSAVKKT